MLLGIDVGGTKVEISLLTLDLQVVKSTLLPTTSLLPGSVGFLDNLLDEIAPFVTPDIRAIGMSLCFPIHNGCTVYSSLLGGAVEISIERIVRDRFSLPVFVNDDLHAHALAEKVLGRGGTDFVILNMGTGVGICQVSNDVVRGHENRAGLICLEQYWIPQLERYLVLDQLICGKGLAFLYGELSRQTDSWRGRKELDAKGIFETKDKDPVSHQVYQIFVKALAKLLTQLTYFFDPEEVVVVGSLKNALPLFKEDVMAEAKRLFPVPFFTPPRLVASTLESGAARGVFLYRRDKGAAENILCPPPLLPSDALKE